MTQEWTYKKGTGPRPADTYRGARRNSTHSTAQMLKQQRLALGISRSALDRQRREKAGEQPRLQPRPFIQMPRTYEGQKLHQIRCRNGVARPPKGKINAA
jgi:hypothetical protein